MSDYPALLQEEVKPKVVVNSIHWDRLDGAASFDDPFRLTVNFTVIEPLDPPDFDITIGYGDGNEEEGLLILEEATISSYKLGQPARAVLEFDPPKIEELAQDQVHGMTSLSVFFTWNENLWMRVTYFLSNMYDDPQLDLDPPEPPLTQQMHRHIHEGELRRVVHYPIDWKRRSAKPSVSSSSVSSSSAVLSSPDPSSTVADSVRAKQSAFEQGLFSASSHLVLHPEAELETDMDVDG